MQRQLIRRKQQANGSNKHPKMPQQQRPSSLRMQMRKGLQLLQQRNGLQRRKGSHTAPSWAHTRRNLREGGQRWLVPTVGEHTGTPPAALPDHVTSVSLHSQRGNRASASKAQQG